MYKYYINSMMYKAKILNNLLYIRTYMYLYYIKCVSI